MEGKTEIANTQAFGFVLGFFCVDFALLDGVLCARFATELLLDCKSLKV